MPVSVPPPQCRASYQNGRPDLSRVAGNSPGGRWSPGAFEIAYGKAMRALARAEGHKPKLPKMCGGNADPEAVQNKHRAEIMAMHRHGMENHEIAKHFGCSTYIISTVILQESGNVQG